MNSKPIYVLECSLSPRDEMYTVDASHDLDLLIRRAEGFVETLYGFVTTADIERGGTFYGYPHHPKAGGEHYAAMVHCVEGRYEEMLDMARRHIKRETNRRETT